LLLLAWLAGACTSEVSDEQGAVLSAQVRALIERSCAKQVCHGEMVSNAYLDFTGELHDVLVNVPACEYDRMARVSPGDPDHSWIMIKLAGPQRFVQYLDFIEFDPGADWQPARPECSGTLPDGARWFGTRMPPVDTTQPLSADEIEIIRRWIEAGAP
jgi:hypothetical protein